MKKLKVILTTCVVSALSTAAMAKTEQITLKANIHYGEEAVIFPTTKGEVILNRYALPSQVAKQLKRFKKGQCLEIQSKYGFYKDTGDGSYIQSIRPCKKNSQPAASNVKR